MKNKWIKKCLILFTAGCLLGAGAGCSQVDTIKEKAQGVAEQVLGDATDSDPEEESQEEEIRQEPEVAVAKPELTTNLSGSVTYKVGDTAKALTVEAKTSDSGTITYQWYQSTTNKNGGGTPIEGATENSYVPSTKEEGTMYYYVVATNSIGSSSDGVTSNTAEVIVSPADAKEEQTEGQKEQTESQETNKEGEAQKTEENAQEEQG